MTDKISDKDKKDWENFLSKDESLPNKDFEISKIKNKKSKLCDLHGYSLDEANRKISELMRGTGKGIREFKKALKEDEEDSEKED